MKAKGEAKVKWMENFQRVMSMLRCQRLSLIGKALIGKLKEAKGSAQGRGVH